MASSTERYLFLSSSRRSIVFSPVCGRASLELVALDRKMVLLLPRLSVSGSLLRPNQIRHLIKPRLQPGRVGWNLATPVIESGETDPVTLFQVADQVGWFGRRLAQTEI